MADAYEINLTLTEKIELFERLLTALRDKPESVTTGTTGLTLYFRLGRHIYLYDPGGVVGPHLSIWKGDDYVMIWQGRLTSFDVLFLRLRSLIKNQLVSGEERLAIQFMRS